MPADAVRDHVHMGVRQAEHCILVPRPVKSPVGVKMIAHDVLRHRILASYEAEAQGKTTDHVIAQILENVPVP